MDVGQPKDFLTGMCLYLTHLKHINSEKLDENSTEVIGNVIIVSKYIIWNTVCITFRV